MDQCVASSAPNSPTSISAASDSAPAGEVGTVGSMPRPTKPEPQLTQRRGFGGMLFDTGNELLLDLPVVLVLDATNGQNALSQIDVFKEVAGVTGLIMTKLDGTARGGVLVAAAQKYGLPIHAIGVGEQIDDLSPFDPEEFAAALTGLDPA